MELREKVKDAILDAWESYDVADDLDQIADAILAIPEIAEALSIAREQRELIQTGTQLIRDTIDSNPRCPHCREPLLSLPNKPPPRPLAQPID